MPNSRSAQTQTQKAALRAAAPMAGSAPLPVLSRATEQVAEVLIRPQSKPGGERVNGKSRGVCEGRSRGSRGVSLPGGSRAWRLWGPLPSPRLTPKPARLDESFWVA
jgi:hypothetical protein